MTDSLLYASLGSEAVRDAARDVDRVATFRALGVPSEPVDEESLSFNAQAVELVALRLARQNYRGDRSRHACRKAFELGRTNLPHDSDGRAAIPSDSLRQCVRVAALGILADLPAQVRALLNAVDIPAILDESASWGDRIERSVLALWLLLFRKQNWADIDLIHATLSSLRDDQARLEPEYLGANRGQPHSAIQLITGFHLLRASEIIARYLEGGEAFGSFDALEQSETHFDRARAAAEQCGDSEMLFLVSLLELTAQQMYDNSVWKAARGIGTLATDFAKQIVSRERSTPLLEFLPPQRKALVEKSLIRSGPRSVVVSLPTSAGKTLVAEFRLLQALENFASRSGWCVYTAPTRALVNQVTTRLRRDFGPLGIRVERVSPALEVDSVEEEILSARDEAPWRVLVATPEKLDLLLRGGWVKELDRPLTLVVVDEAHNLGSGTRGLRLELLLATINREAREASFLLLTPFVPNAEEISAWLDPLSNEAVELGIEWLPNDRVIGLAALQRGSRRGDSRIVAETVHTTAASLYSAEVIPLAEGRPLGRTWSDLKSPNLLAAATATRLSGRGSTVLLVQRPDYAWTAAATLARETAAAAPNEMVRTVQSFLSAEYGTEYPLVELLQRGVAVHHAGLAEDVRMMVELLAAEGSLQYVVATTTLAQGINFPIANVVMASNQYPYGEEMPPEDFWNIAGRAGRADHGQPGVVLLAAPDESQTENLTSYIYKQATALGSTLVDMVLTAIRRFGTLDLARLSFMGDWSAFVQFITHTFRVVGLSEFALQVENVLRGTLGYRHLRSEYPVAAEALLRSVRAYAEGLAGKPLALVDATGFSLESVSAALVRMHDAGIRPDIWRGDIFEEPSTDLRDAIGVLLQVPELHEQLVQRLEPSEASGDFLARVIKDWVAGRNLVDLANAYFGTTADGRSRNVTTSLTVCCQRLFGSILPAVSWGLSALQALHAGQLSSESELELDSRDLSSYVYYGVKTRNAVALRLFGVPRGAAPSLATHLSSAGGDEAGNSTRDLRGALASSTENDWKNAMGDIGGAYFKAWRLLEPVK